RSRSPQVRGVLDAGAALVKDREHGLDAASQVALTAEAVQIARGSGTHVVVNDRLDVAIAAGADGVHLRADSIPIAGARAAAPPGFLVGRSVHELAEAVRATGADYLIAGTVFPSESKPGSSRLLGEEGLAAITRSVQMPVLAIGGVTLEHVPAVAAAGASGIAAIELFMGKEAVGGWRSGPADLVVATARARVDRANKAF